MSYRLLAVCEGGGGGMVCVEGAMVCVEGAMVWRGPWWCVEGPMVCVEGAMMVCGGGHGVWSSSVIN